jgi:hypothetical protein
MFDDGFPDDMPEAVTDCKINLGSFKQFEIDWIGLLDNTAVVLFED